MNARTILSAIVVVASVALSGFSVTASAVPIPKTDIVFVIDATGSMTGEIGGVKSGFSDFVSGLNAASVDARFAIILFGGAPEIVQDFTSNTTATETALGKISASGAVAGFQNNHNVNPEAGLEVIRIALGGATDNTLARDNVGGTGGLDYRSGARKNLIFVTDEDSDVPYFAANRFSGQPGFGGSNGNQGSPPTGTNPLAAAFQDEVDLTAQVVIDNKAFLNMLINIGDAPSKAQYGDNTKDVSDADFLNFDAAATLAALLADSNTDNSLQAQVLGSGLTARSFDVAGANDPDFIKNFFAAKLEEIKTDPGVSVPEPASLALLGLGLLGLGAVRRRMR